MVYTLQMLPSYSFLSTMVATSFAVKKPFILCNPIIISQHYFLGYFFQRVLVNAYILKCSFIFT